MEKDQRLKNRHIGNPKMALIEQIARLQIAIRRGAGENRLQPNLLANLETVGSGRRAQFQLKIVGLLVESLDRRQHPYRTGNSVRNVDPAEPINGDGVDVGEACGQGRSSIAGVADFTGPRDGIQGSFRRKPDNLSTGYKRRTNR